MCDAQLPGKQPKRKRIVSQLLVEQGVWTEFEDGSLVLMPYLEDTDGTHYVDIDPNQEIFWLK